jgi:hypothetical protein
MLLAEAPFWQMPLCLADLARPAAAAAAAAAGPLLLLLSQQGEGQEVMAAVLALALAFVLPQEAVQELLVQAVHKQAVEAVQQHQLQQQLVHQRASEAEEGTSSVSCCCCHLLLLLLPTAAAAAAAGRVIQVRLLLLNFHVRSHRDSWQTQAAAQSCRQLQQHCGQQSLLAAPPAAAAAGVA